MLQESGRKRKWDLMAPAPEASQPAVQSPAVMGQGQPAALGQGQPGALGQGPSGAMGQGQPGMHEGGQFSMSQPQHGHFPPQAGSAPDAGYQNLFGGGYPVQVSCWLFVARNAHEMRSWQRVCHACWCPQGRDNSERAFWSPFAIWTSQVKLHKFEQP